MRAALATMPGPGAPVVRVAPDVAAIDREFDYLVPADLADRLVVGSRVAVDLGGRRVSGWVTASGVTPAEGIALRPVARWRGWGPEPALVDLAEWAAWRWAGRRSALLGTASPLVLVTALPAPAMAPPAAPAGPAWPPASAGLLADLPAGAPLVLRWPPAADPTPAVAAVAQLGPTLVVVPSQRRVEALADRLRRAGAGVAVLPGDWAQARAGAGVVIGTRAAVWAPCPALAAVVVLDGHDEALSQPQAPTWHAAVVAAERARRAGAACVVLSPCPTLDLLAAGVLRRPSRDAERAGWAALEVVDRRRDDPRLGLYSRRLADLVRSAPRVVCVLNRTGRARLLACSACGELARCERCGAAVAQQPGPAASPDAAAGPFPLACPRCGTVRPPVCTACWSTSLRHLRVGVTRAREELEALAGRPVGEVTAATEALPVAEVLVGTEAVLHRVVRADVVAFLDFDQELLAARLRAGEEALALLAGSARLVGGRRASRRHSGRVLVQTRMPDHDAIRAALLADPDVLAGPEADLRRSLRLPPAAAVAVVSGPLAERYAGELRAAGVEVLGPGGGRWLVRAADHGALADALAAVPRPPGRLRVAVDPPRL